MKITVIGAGEHAGNRDTRARGGHEVEIADRLTGKIVVDTNPVDTQTWDRTSSTR